MPISRSHRKTDTPVLSEDFDETINKLIKDPSLGEGRRPMEELVIRPTQQSSIDLGTYTRSHPPKGFCVGIDPDPQPENSVVTRILHTGDRNEYTLTLTIANWGTRVVTAKIWRL